jgi:hypothetical protein
MIDGHGCNEAQVIEGNNGSMTESNSGNNGEAPVLPLRVKARKR